MLSSQFPDFTLIFSRFHGFWEVQFVVPPIWKADRWSQFEICNEFLRLEQRPISTIFGRNRHDSGTHDEATRPVSEVADIPVYTGQYWRFALLMIDIRPQTLREEITKRSNSALFGWFALQTNHPISGSAQITYWLPPELRY